MQNFPDTSYHFTNITLLAASQACAVLAAAFAQSIDKSITVDSADVNEKTRKYMDLAKMYFNQYSAIVFGADEMGDKNLIAATTEKHYDEVTSAGTPYIFHARATDQ